MAIGSVKATKWTWVGMIGLVALAGLPASAAEVSLRPASAEQAEASQPAAEAKAPAFDESDFFVGWKRNVEVGLNGSDGNSETLSVRGALGAERTASDMETKVGITYVYASSDGQKSKSRGELNARNDWLFGDSPWGFFALGKVEYDEFQAWDWRLSGYVGPSYAFIKDDRTLLRGRVGVGSSYEIGGPDEKFVPELVLGLDFTHKLNDRTSIFASADYYPSLSDFPDFRVDAKAGLDVIVDPDSGMLLKLGINDRYDSDPGAGKKRNDIEYFATLAWTF